MLGFETNFFRDTNYRFHKAVVLEHVFPRQYRSLITAVTGTIVLVYILVLAASRFLAHAPLQTYALLEPTTPVLNGVFLIALAVFLAMKMLKWYGQSHYYYVEGLLERGKTGAQTP